MQFKFIRIGEKIVNLQHVKFIELIESVEEREIRFHFTDGSCCSCKLSVYTEDREFWYVWGHLSNLKVLS
jgi:hypothetical protein